MAYTYVKLTGKIDRRSPQNEGKQEDPVLCENWLSRDGVLRKPPGHTAQFTGLADIPRWMGRYYTVEVGTVSPKSFVYTQNGGLYVLDDTNNIATLLLSTLNTNARPKHWLFKSATQTKMFLVDGERLYQYDGNNNNTFVVVDLEDNDGNSVKPIDVIEHKDRLFVISRTSLFVSKNLDPEDFSDADDSIEIIVGSGKGINLYLGKIEDKLYILNTEGIFVLDGDVISALATTFEVRLVDERRIIAGGTAHKVEKAILFIGDDYELWSWDGSTTTMLSFELKLKDFIFKNVFMLDKAVSIYHNNYYKMSFVGNGDTEPNVEVWWDAFEDKLHIVKGRQITCYMRTDPTIEEEYLQFGQSTLQISQEGIGNDFNSSAIATRLRSRDLTPKKGINVRFSAFYPEFMPTGNRNIIIRYLLDGRSSNPTDANAHWEQNLRGEIKSVTALSISNQAQFTGRVRPKINYARGESVAFEIVESTVGLKCDFLGIGIEYIAKFASKKATIGA